jgi:hypothetical protein
LSKNKVQLEQDMFKKFCVILNQKKTKIKNLQAEKEQLLSQRQFDRPAEVNPLPTQQNTDERRIDNEGLSGEDTEDEPMDVTNLIALPSSQQVSFHLNGPTQPTPNMDLLSSMDTTFKRREPIRVRHHQNTTTTTINNNKNANTTITSNKSIQPTVQKQQPDKANQPIIQNDTSSSPPNKKRKNTQSKDNISVDLDNLVE